MGVFTFNPLINVALMAEKLPEVESIARRRSQGVALISPRDYSSQFYRTIRGKHLKFLPLDEAIASRAVFIIMSGSDGRAQTLLEPAKYLKNGKR